MEKQKRVVFGSTVYITVIEYYSCNYILVRMKLYYIWNLYWSFCWLIYFYTSLFPLFIIWPYKIGWNMIHSVHVHIMLALVDQNISITSKCSKVWWKLTSCASIAQRQTTHPNTAGIQVQLPGAIYMTWMCVPSVRSGDARKSVGIHLGVTVWATQAVDQQVKRDF